MATRVLLLAGTAEARRLAAAVGGQPGIALTSSLAGAVAVPLLPEGDVRIGGFGGAGLTGWLRDHDTDAVVDATHPFATRMTDDAVAATAALRLPLLVLRRPGWTAGPGDRWHRVPDMAAAAALAPRLGERVFLAIGSGGLAAFADAPGWFLLRADRPARPSAARAAPLRARPRPVHRRRRAGSAARAPDRGGGLPGQRRRPHRGQARRRPRAGPARRAWWTGRPPRGVPTVAVERP